MPKALRKTIEIPLIDGVVAVDVDFSILEVVERVYDMRAEYVAALLERPVKILRSKVAEVIVGWLSARTLDYTRQEIREAVITAKPDVLNRYIGAIQAAILYSLREITEDEFDLLARGEGLDDPDDPEHKKKLASNDSSQPPTD